MRNSALFPPKALWKGRFFHKVYPLGDGTTPDDVIKFGVDSGAYTVESVSPSGYRANAAAAKFSKVVAREYYGLAHSRIYGYIYGGSGGSYLTISAAENSSGVWDGAVPFVIGVPTSIPTNFFVRAFARLVLEDKAPQIADAMRPGGSGDPFAGLNATEAQVLAEVSAMGVPCAVGIITRTSWVLTILKACWDLRIRSKILILPTRTISGVNPVTSAQSNRHSAIWFGQRKSTVQSRSKRSIETQPGSQYAFI